MYIRSSKHFDLQCFDLQPSSVVGSVWFILLSRDTFSNGFVTQFRTETKTLRFVSFCQLSFSTLFAGMSRSCEEDRLVRRGERR